MKERRRAERVARRFTVYFEAEGQKSRGVILNLSEVGVYLQSDRGPSPGTAINFPFQWGNSPPFTLSGTVVWRKRQSGLFGRGLTCWGFGVALDAAPSEYVSAVAGLKKSLSPAVPRSREERFEVYHRVRFASGAEFRTEYTENLSRGGMYLATEEKLEPGTSIRARLDIPGIEEILEIQGRVTYRLEGAEARERGRSPGVGVRFVNLPDAVRTKLEHYLARLEAHRAGPSRRTGRPVPAFGSLAELLVPEILLGLNEREATGILRIESRNVTKKVYFHKGVPVFVDSTLSSESFGRYLVKRGVLKLEAMADWLPALEQGDVRLCRDLVASGTIEGDTALDIWAEYHEEKLIHAFSWFDGSFVFSEGSDWPDSVVVVPMQIHRVVFEGVRRWFSATMVSAWMGLKESSSLRCDRPPPPDAIVPKAVHDLIGAFGESRTIRRIAEERGESLEHLIPLCYALVLEGWASLNFASDAVSTRREPKASVALSSLPDFAARVEEDLSRLTRFDFYELLGVKADSSAEEITRAFLARSSAYSAGDPAFAGDDALAKKVTQILSWLQMARNTLTEPKLRRRYDRQRMKGPSQNPVRSEMEIEAALADAIFKVENGEADKASVVLSELREDFPGSAALLGYLGWVMFRRNRRDNAERAASMLDSAVAQDPSDPRLEYFRGEVLEFRGRLDEAAAAYSKASRLDPAFSKAAVALESIRAKQSERLCMSRALGLDES